VRSLSNPHLLAEMTYVSYGCFLLSSTLILMQTPAEQNGTTFYSDPGPWLVATADLYDFLQPYALPASESPPSGNGHEVRYI
jgi:hypothetical protein